MKKSRFLNITNHKLSDGQKRDLRQSNVFEHLEMGDENKEIWGNIPTEDINIYEVVKPVAKQISTDLEAGDIALVQGEFGATKHIVDVCRQEGVIPVYAVSKREVEETEENGQIVKKSVFKHVRFREYPL